MTTSGDAGLTESDSSGGGGSGSDTVGWSSGRKRSLTTYLRTELSFEITHNHGQVSVPIGRERGGGGRAVGGVCPLLLLLLVASVVSCSLILVPGHVGPPESRGP